MAIILIDARHYGEQLRHARRMLNMNAATAARLLKISVHDLHRYELGRAPIPPDLICVLLHRGLAMSACRVYNVVNAKK